LLILVIDVELTAPVEVRLAEAAGPAIAATVTVPEPPLLLLVTAATFEDV
jgi:hypothetical protein